MPQLLFISAIYQFFVDAGTVSVSEAKTALRSYKRFEKLMFVRIKEIQHQATTIKYLLFIKCLKKKSGCAGPGRIFQSLKESLLIHYSLKNVHCALFPQYTINITAERRSISDRASAPAKEEKVYAGAHKGSLHRIC